MEELNKNEIKWLRIYKYACKYYECYGNLEVPRYFKTNDGINHRSDGKINLGLWIETQRQSYKHGKLSQERKDMLVKIDMRLENVIYKLSWEEAYGYACKYYECYGNLEVPINFKTNDGFSYRSDGKLNLGLWIETQKKSCRKGKFSQEKKDKLEKIGVRFEYKYLILSWEEMYEYASKYYECHGNLEVPNRFKTNDGINYSIDGKLNLGVWIENQRQSFRQGKLSQDRTEKLEKIGVRFEYKYLILSWKEMYEYASKYYEYHSNLEVPIRFKTNDGINYSVDGKINLGAWIHNQRHSYKYEKLSQERIDKLEKIGMIWFVSILSWEEVYEYASKYYEYHGNFNVPRYYKTNNGINYSVDGKINLGVWLNSQRQSFRQGKLSQERKDKLEKIGIIWSVRRYKQVIKECERNNIDCKLNKDIIEHITLEELEGKIRYLESNGESVVDERGRLHRIFNMSNMDIQMEFGISLEEIVFSKKLILS